jgi:hypothetical protein
MSLSGEVQIFGSDHLTISSSPLHNLGAKGVAKDGRVFRYAKAGAADLAPGKLAVAADVVANHINIAVQAAAAVGDMQVSVTLGATAVVANLYAGGHLVVSDVDGEGISYLISGHAAHAGSGTLVVKLSEPVKVALTTNSEVSLQQNPFSGLQISVTDQTDMAIGIPNVAITAAYYGWVQTRGVCAALADEAITAGLALTIGTGVAGALEALDAAGEAQIGVAIMAAVDTEYRPVFLMLD